MRTITWGGPCPYRHAWACALHAVARPDGVRPPLGSPGGAIVYADKAIITRYHDGRGFIGDLCAAGRRPAAFGSFFGCRLGFRVGKQLESDQNWAKIPKIDLKTAGFQFFTIFQSPTPFIF